MDYASHVTDTRSRQGEPADATQVENRSGSFVWGLDELSRLRRFLILGTEGGTYYAGEGELTRENAQVIDRMIEAGDGQTVVAEATMISDQGRALKNEPALFALALCSVAADRELRVAALKALPTVARIPTHLWTFIEYRHTLGGGWGRAMRKAVASWYEQKPIKLLAYHAIKYRQRAGWTHRDALRLAHPETDDPSRKLVFSWMVDPDATEADKMILPTVIHGFELLKSMTDENGEIPDEHLDAAIQTIRGNKLPREALPTSLLARPEVWEALLPEMPMTAMIRNLVSMTRVGFLKDGTEAMEMVTDRLTTEERLRESRIHPLSILMALGAYRAGGGERSRGLDAHREGYASGLLQAALDRAFHLSFGNVEATRKRILIGLDVSASMTWTENYIATGLDARTGSAAMALTMFHSEPEGNVDVMTFSDQGEWFRVLPKETLASMVERVGRLRACSTDCSLPIELAAREKRQFDAFVIFTDNETNHPHSRQAASALRAYRGTVGPRNAKLAVVGMTSNGFSIADPHDGGMMDFVGFDTATPDAIKEFISS